MVVRKLKSCCSFYHKSSSSRVVVVVVAVAINVILISLNVFVSYRQKKL